MSNQEIAKILYEMAALYDVEGVRFKPRAYEKVALEVEATEKDIWAIYKSGGSAALMKEIPGVGPGIAAHIEALLLGKHFKEYERLKKKVPVAISELTAVEGVGPKMVKVLWEKLKIKTLADLEKAVRTGKIRKLSHFGEKSEQKILKGIEFLKSSGGRQVLGFVLPEIRQLEKTIQSFPEVEQVVVAGSVRRRKETIGDIDILATSSKPKKVMERFLDLPFIAHVYGSGQTKTNVRLKNGLDADLRVVPEESFGAALNYFTGSKAHNIALREIAIKKGWKLNEYGLFKGNKIIVGRTEVELYKKLGMRYIEPEMREHSGEIELSRKNKLPSLIGYGDLKGDLQTQTDWTDGSNSIKEMAYAAKKDGLEYIAITDHTRTLAMTGGADEKKLARQGKEIDRLNEELRGFKILKGAEVNIMPDGSLDIKDESLAKLDIVGAAVHSHFNLQRAEQTKRLIRAMENPHVDIIFHLTARRIGKREPIELDIDEIIEAAKRTGTILEIDAFPDRLDIKDEYIRKCVAAGVKMCIDSDAHSVQHFKLLEYGIAQARRGWATKSDIINAWPVEKMLAFLKK
ncbi:MAG: DNA polymerase III [Candidatus Sungbacteria bacterium RIFCSPHIGHO2_02_FULL_47_11]|uniref:DNA-directed DNA polymerase n=1 Tax=Candidatus Sungbacteria bacterium RIFCSPHIGHO2_02_FULL_47_11 TaxID=1802270 RepID=A0A1G2KGL4_9BACT|nr:MAG: DNA polymerase III [Candidatus Sungbacteria bacterium RIFCSPHIGHO2_02_FULL_47_11]